MEEVRYHQKHLSSSQLHTLSKQTEITEAQDHELMHTECCFSCPSLIHKPHCTSESLLARFNPDSERKKLEENSP